MPTADIEAVLQIEAASFPDPLTRESLLYDLGENPAARHLAALWEGEVCGWLGVYFVLDEGQILRVATSPPFRRRRVAKALVSQMLRRGKEAGLAFFTLEVRSQNEAAIRLYSSLCFTQNGRRRGYYQNPADDALLMELIL
jgi:ribosomal-protein-alanine N-acetyltransferase